MKTAFNWLFRNRETGATTIGQFPNVPLFVFAGAATLAWLLPAGGRPALAAWIFSRLALAWWAADEVLRGVNPWRRLLGGTMLAWLLYGVLR